MKILVHGTHRCMVCKLFPTKLTTIALTLVFPLLLFHCAHFFKVLAAWQLSWASTAPTSRSLTLSSHLVKTAPFEKDGDEWLLAPFLYSPRVTYTQHAHTHQTHTHITCTLSMHISHAHATCTHTHTQHTANQIHNALTVNEYSLMWHHKTHKC